MNTLPSLDLSLRLAKGCQTWSLRQSDNPTPTQSLDPILLSEILSHITEKRKPFLSNSNHVEAS